MTNHERVLSNYRQSVAAFGAAACLCLLFCSPSGAKPPSLKARVTDKGQVLGSAVTRSIESQLRAYEEATGHQFAVLIVKDLEGLPVEDYSMAVVENWKLGQAKFDNGLLLLVAIAERKLRIEVGYGLEGVIPDAVAAGVIRQVMTPLFREGDVAGGIRAGLEVLMKAGRGEKVDLPNPRKTRHKSSGGLWGLVKFLFIVFFFLGPLLGRRRGGGLGAYAALAAGSMLMGGQSRGSSSGGFSSGGFSGGGGGFGGGGASGSW